MKTPSKFPLSIRQYGYVTRFADVPAFSTCYSVRGTFLRLMGAELGLLYSLRMTAWWFFRALIVHRRELSF